MEQVLADIKRIVEVETFLSQVEPGGDGANAQTRQIATRAVRWCIEYFYWTH